MMGPWQTIEEPASAAAEDIFAVPHADVEAYRLAAAQARFADLRPRVRILDRLAANQGIDAIESLDDVVPVLFQHTVYKSYPLSLLERSRFDRLTQWLDQLTAHDLSAVDASAVGSIDEWLDLLDAGSPMRLVHSSATTGKLSFLPRSTSEDAPYGDVWFHHFGGFGSESGPDFDKESFPIVLLGYGAGRLALQRRVGLIKDRLSPPGVDPLALYPIAQSADLMSFAGRAQAAADKGMAADTLQVSEHLLARRAEFAQFRSRQSEHIDAFITAIRDRVADQPIFASGSMSNYLDVALRASERGIGELFDPASLIVAGGGFKGRADVPDDWQERIQVLVGGAEIANTYGMTELMPHMRACSQDRFHIPPYVVPYVLDPGSGEALPRHGVQVGRFAFLDLLASTHWGGFITGDKVTMHFDGDCGCGRSGIFLESRIERYSASQGGDDKNSCARVGDAHDRAIDVLMGM